MNSLKTLLASVCLTLLAFPFGAWAETPSCHGEVVAEGEALPQPVAPAQSEHAGHGEHAAHLAAAQASAGDAEASQIQGLDPVGLDVELFDQDGKVVNFYDDLVKDRVVAMNFVFTTCTTVCPPMGASFGRLQKELGEHYGRDVHLISVSVDPVTDTPQRLKTWSQQFDAGDGWTLVTGPKAQVNQVLKVLNVFTPDSKDHAPLVLLGDDRTGTWQKAHGFTPPAKLASLLEGYLEEREVASETKTNLETESDDEEGKAAL